MQKSAMQAGGVGRFVRASEDAIVMILKLVVGEVGEVVGLTNLCGGSRVESGSS
jgi:hypothetical protein